MNNKNKENYIFALDKTKELQNDWQGYGKTSVYYGLVVLFIFVVSMLYHIFTK